MKKFVFTFEVCNALLCAFCACMMYGYAMIGEWDIFAVHSLLFIANVLNYFCCAYTYIKLSKQK